MRNAGSPSDHEGISGTDYCHPALAIDIDQIVQGNLDLGSRCIERKIRGELPMVRKFERTSSRVCFD